MVWRRAFAPIAAVAISAQAASADEPAAHLAVLGERAADAVEVLRGARPQTEVFTPAFIAAVPPAQLDAIARQLRETNGQFTGISDLNETQPWAARFTIGMERAEATATIQLEAEAPHRIAGFFISGVTPRGDNAERIAADFAALPGASGFVVARLGQGGPVVLAGQDADRTMAIGSAFKLWVLEALAEEIRLGKRRWRDVVPLGPPSLPSGIMQNWPQSAPVTLETLATLMISQSDNTATDTLIHLLGRRTIERRVVASGHHTPAAMMPFLTTVEAFTLKAREPTTKASWVASDTNARRTMLTQLKPDAAHIDLSRLEIGKPNAIEAIEWFASPLDVARVLDALRRHHDPRVRSILAVSPALPTDRQAGLAYTGYKGGSEMGVISLNWLIQSRSGAWYAIAATWNDHDAAVDDGHFATMVQRLFNLAK